MLKNDERFGAIAASTNERLTETHAAAGRASKLQGLNMSTIHFEHVLEDSEELLLLRANQVARALGLSRSTIYAMMSGGTLPVVRVGRSVRVPRQALLDWVARKTTEAA